MGCSMCREPKATITPEQRVRINAVLDYWYGAGVERNVLNEAWFPKWFGFSEEIDDEVKDNFMGDYENYTIGEYSGWVNDRDGRLAAILITDQFSRQLFRKQAKAFDTDKLALNLALKAMRSEDWANYATFEKFFILMVLMHQENGKYTRMQITESMKLDREN